jgi:alpha-beta hydrolase superfamily lysophospholipase
LRAQADQVVCLEEPENFSAVGLWYEDFEQLRDEDIARFVKPFEGDLKIPKGGAKAVVLFAHGSGSSRFSKRNQKVSDQLNQAGFATLLFDLLTEEESADRTRVFDIPFLANRLIAATQWVRNNHPELPLGYFGASTGAAAALWAAADLGPEIYAVVSRGGRPDLAMSRLEQVRAPTLLIVGGEDTEVIEMNRHAQSKLKSSELVLIPGATHLFEEPGALDEVARLAIQWFEKQLQVLRKVA